MDQTNSPDSINQIYRLLALCARAEGHFAFYAQLAQQLRDFTAWKELPVQAELHDLGPLLWHHLRQSGCTIPPTTAQTLRGLYLRQRLFAQAQTRVLLEVSALFEQAGIRALLLKGLGLAYQVYPDPALRPIGDIDLLLNQADLLPAINLLAGAGYRVDPLHTSTGQLPWEVTADSPLQDGHSTHLELHYFGSRGRAVIDDYSMDDEFTGFDAPPCPLVIEKCTVYLPGDLDNIIYLSKHFTRHLFSATDEKPLPLKWMADIISFVECHAATLDWDQLQRRNPLFMQQLAVFYSLTPMPESLQQMIPVQPGSPPHGINRYSRGWPAESYFRKRVGIWRYVWQTFTPPSDWWLRLYYGINARSIFWYGQFIYRWQVLQRLFWVIIHKI